MAYEAHILDSSKALVGSLIRVRWSIDETLNAKDSLTLTTADVDKFDLIKEQNTFIRLVNPDDASDKRTYRVQTINEQQEQGKRFLTVEANRIWIDASREIVADHQPFKGAYLKDLVTKAMSYSQFDAGTTVSSDTTLIDNIDLSYISVLDALQQLADKAGLEIEIDESSSPEKIDLVERGSANGVAVQYGQNIAGIQKHTKRGDLATRVYATGAGNPVATVEGALFEVYSVSTTTITVAGDKCIPSDDTYTGGSYQIKFMTGAKAGVTYSITDTTRGSSGDDDTIVSGTDLQTAGVVAGDFFKFVDGSGNDIDYVFDKTAEDTYGTWDRVVREGSYENTSNLVNNGFLDGTYSGGLHANWSKINGAETVSENTDTTYFQHGTASQKVVAGSAGHGISRSITLDSSELYSAGVNLYVESGSVVVKIEGTNGEEYLNQEGTSGTGEFITVKLAGIPIEGNTATLSIYANGGASTFHVDAVVFTSGDQVKTFIRNNGARELYRLAFDYLEDRKAPVVEYQIPDAIDFFEVDSVAYENEQIAIGDTVTAINADLGIASDVRVLSVRKDDRGRNLRLTLSTHTDTVSAFNSLSSGAGAFIRARREANAQRADLGNLTEDVRGSGKLVNQMVPITARGIQFDGEIRSTSYNSISILGSGGGATAVLRIGNQIRYTLSSLPQSISGLTADTVYYLYFDPASASSRIQSTTDASTAFGVNVAFLGRIKTGATSDDKTQVYQVQGTGVRGEMQTAGLEAYDDNGDKRVDVGHLQDPPHASAYNPSDWGIQINEGVFYQDGLYPAVTSGSEPSALRTLYATFGDEDEDLIYDTTTKRIVGDDLFMSGKFATGVGSSFGLYGRQTSLSVESGSSGLAWADRATVANVGTGDAVGYIADSITQSGGTGHAIGFAVGGYGVFGSGIRATGGSGNAYGIYIKTVSSAGGSAFSIYDASTARAYFSGSISVRGVDYVWPSSDGTANYVLSTDGSGNLSWVSNSGSGFVTGSGTTNYVPKWTSSTALGNSVIQESSSKIGVGVTPSYLLHIKDATDTALNMFTMESVFSSGGKKSISWLDTSSIVGAIGLEFDTVSSVDFTVHSLYNSGYNTTELFRIKGNGNVGIGTGSPSYKIHAVGSGVQIGVGVDANNVITLYGGDGSGNSPAITWNANSTGNDVLRFYDNGSGVERMRIDDSGNVGIGKSPVSASLEVYKASASTGIIIDSDTGYNSGVVLQEAGSGKWNFAYDATANEAYFYNYTASRKGLILTDTGDARIAGSTTNQALTLSVSGAGSTSLIFETYNDNANNRNWAFRNRYSSYGVFELMRGTTSTDNPSVTVLSIGYDSMASAITTNSYGVGIGSSAVSGGARLRVVGSKGVYHGLIYIDDGTSSTTGVGGGITFRGLHTSATYYEAGAIASYKTGSGADYQTSMRFYSTNNVGTMVHQMSLNQTSFGVHLDGSNTLFAVNSASFIHGVGSALSFGNYYGTHHYYEAPASNYIYMKSTGGSGSDYSGILGLTSGGSGIGGYMVQADGALIRMFMGSVATPSTYYDQTGTIHRLMGGNVGIGVTPDSNFKLDILGSGGNQVYAGQDLQIKTTSTSTVGEGTGIRLSAIAGGKETVGIIGVVHTSGVNGDMTFHTYEGGATMPEKMRITSSGNVGIGTSSPDTLLHTWGGNSGATGFGYSGVTIEHSSHAGLNIQTTDASDGMIAFSTPTGGAFSAFTQHNYNSSAYQMATNYATGFIEFRTGSNTFAMRIDSSQNVGIGNTSVASNGAGSTVLNVNGSTGAGTLHLTNNTTGVTNADGFLAVASGSDAYLINRESGNMYFRTADTNRMTIDSSGNVGIGRNPTAMFDLYGANNAYLQRNDTTSSVYWGWFNSTGANGLYVGLDNSAGTGFGSGTNQGAVIYTHAGNPNIVFLPGTTKTLTVNSSASVFHSGNVGIGTTSPDGTLHAMTNSAGSVIAHPVADDLIIENNVDMGLSFLTSNTAQSYILFGDTDDNTSGQIVYDHNTDSLRFVTGASYVKARFYNTYSEFYQGGAVRLLIHTDGHVYTQNSANMNVSGTLGVGISNPSVPLHIQGTGNTYAYIATTSTTAITGLYFFENTTTLGAGLQYTASDNSMLIGTVTSGNFGISTNNTTRATFDTNGRMGLATASPSSRLHLYDGSSGTTAGIRLENNSGSDWGMGELVFNNTFSIYDFGASDGRLNIQNDGDVGIGTQTPNARLHVAKSTTYISGSVLQVENSNASTASTLNCLSVFYSNVAPDNYDHYFITCADSGTVRLIVYADGDLANHDGTYGTISDARLKFDIKPARSYWDDFKQLSHKTYKHIHDGVNGERRFGVVAQDVREIFPALAPYGADGKMFVKSSIIHEIGMSVLVEAQKRIETNEERITRLEKRVDELETEVAYLKAS